jgi:NAD(P)-dependent dehydrogenase (short-subunit alcohol dehydrogenase family)
MTSRRTVVVTGANSGIGYQTALYFARAGAHVVMACRNMAKADQAARAIREEVPDASTTTLPLDVSELRSVHEFARLFGEQVGELDVLINNAGVAALPLARNSVGHELQFATNHLGGFALTGALLPYFAKDRKGRIVNLGSLAHRFGKLDLDDLNWQTARYDHWKAYANSKVAALSHALELNRRLRKAGSNVSALAAHPGFANTEMNQKSELLRPKTAFKRWYTKHMAKVIPSAALAARSVIRAATADDVRGGEYIGPSGLFELGGSPGKARVNPLAADIQLAARLWAASETLADVRYLSAHDPRA